MDLLVVDCSWIVKGRNTEDKLQHNFPYTDIMSGDEMIATNGIPWAPWKYIVNRTFIIKHQIFFEEHERIEDVDWCFKVVHTATKVQYQPILLIYYTKNSISTTMTAYKSPETIYSTLRMGMRLNRLIYTDFVCSTDKVKKRVADAAMVFYNIALREYLFFYDSAKIKRDAINVCVNEFNNNGSHLINIAKQYPMYFSIISNLLYPFFRLVLSIYRTIKYQ